MGLGQCILDYLNGPNLITWVLKVRRVFPVVVRGRCDSRRKAHGDATLLALETEDRARSQGMQAASKS